MFRPMILLACGVAIPDLHTRLARLETDTTLLLTTALGAAADIDLVDVHHLPLSLHYNTPYHIYATSTQHHLHP
jgi:hypothetical protein